MLVTLEAIVNQNTSLAHHHLVKTVVPVDSQTISLMNANVHPVSVILLMLSLIRDQNCLLDSSRFPENKSLVTVC